MHAHLLPGPLRLGLGLAGSAVLVAACGSTGSYGTSTGGTASHAAATSSTGKVETHKGALGTYLTDGAGRTLYLFQADHGSTSSCSGACASAWPPLTTKGAPATAGQARAGMLGTTNRGGGVKQVTYAGHPLYYYAGDTGAGDTSGQGIDGFGAKWWVVDPSGSAITSSGATGGGY